MQVGGRRSEKAAAELAFGCDASGQRAPFGRALVIVLDGRALLALQDKPAMRIVEREFDDWLGVQRCCVMFSAAAGASILCTMFSYAVQTGFGELMVGLKLEDRLVVRSCVVKLIAGFSGKSTCHER